MKEPPYEVSECGYAGFLMTIEVHFRSKEEPKKVILNYDLFLNTEQQPPVNHIRCEKLTFHNPTEDFRRKLLKAGGVNIFLNRLIRNVQYVHFTNFNSIWMKDGKFSFVS